MQELAVAFAVVLLAELGDKTQLAILALAARGKPFPVWAGAVAAFALLTAVAAALGGLAAATVPPGWASAIGGALLVALGAWTFFTQPRAEAEARTPAAAFATTFTLVLLAEAGDKSQLATAALAARGEPVLVGLGAFAGLAAAAGLAVWGGRWLARHVRPALMRRIAGVVLVLTGLAVLILR